MEEPPPKRVRISDQTAKNPVAEVTTQLGKGASHTVYKAKTGNTVIRHLMDPNDLHTFQEAIKYVIKMCKHKEHGPNLKSLLPPAFSLYKQLDITGPGIDIEQAHAMIVERCNKWYSSLSDGDDDSTIRDSAAAHFAKGVIKALDEAGIAFFDMKPDNCAVEPLKKQFCFIDIDAIAPRTLPDGTPNTEPMNTYRGAGIPHKTFEGDADIDGWNVFIHRTETGLTKEQKKEAVQNIVDYTLLWSLAFTTICLATAKINKDLHSAALWAENQNFNTSGQRLEALIGAIKQLKVESYPKTRQVTTSLAERLSNLLTVIPQQLQIPNTFATFASQ